MSRRRSNAFDAAPDTGDDNDPLPVSGTAPRQDESGAKPEPAWIAAQAAINARKFERVRIVSEWLARRIGRKTATAHDLRVRGYDLAALKRHGCVAGLE